MPSLFLFNALNTKKHLMYIRGHDNAIDYINNISKALNGNLILYHNSLSRNDKKMLSTNIKNVEVFIPSTYSSYSSSEEKNDDPKLSTNIRIYYNLSIADVEMVNLHWGNGFGLHSAQSSSMWSGSSSPLYYVYSTGSSLPIRGCSTISNTHIDDESHIISLCLYSNFIKFMHDVLSKTMDDGICYYVGSNVSYNYTELIEKIESEIHGDAQCQNTKL